MSARRRISRVVAVDLGIAGDKLAATGETMLYMVIEHFKDGAVPEIYRRFREKGRMMPDGLNYVSSWIDTDLKACYQLMETDDAALFTLWTENWDDLMEFKIVPVRTSAETAALVEKSK